MNRNLILLTALGAGLLSAGVASAQAAAPAASSASAPQAIPAKIALINFEQVVLASNEGQTVALTTQKKFEPRKAQLETQSNEIDSLKKNVPATLPDDEKASRLRTINTKEQTLQRDAEAAQTEYSTELQEALGKVATKVAVTARSYADQNGYTMVLDVSGQQNNVFWVSPKSNTDISQAVVDAYNKSSGIAAPAPSAPSGPRPATTPARPATRPSGK